MGSQKKQVEVKGNIAGSSRGELLCVAFDIISAQTKRVSAQEKYKYHIFPKGEVPLTLSARKQREDFCTRHRVEGCQVKGRPDMPLALDKGDR